MSVALRVRFLGMGKHGAGAHIVWDWNGTLFHDIDAVIEATNASFAEIGLRRSPWSGTASCTACRSRASTSG